jgi:hypothetical protein
VTIWGSSGGGGYEEAWTSLPTHGGASDKGEPSPLYPADGDWSELPWLALDLSRDGTIHDKPSKTPPAGIVIIKPKQKADMAPDTVLELWLA